MNPSDEERRFAYLPDNSAAEIAAELKRRGQESRRAKSRHAEHGHLMAKQKARKKRRKK